MKKICAVAVIIATLLLTGCYDSTELGSRALIQALAIDYDGQYHVSAMLFSSSGSGGDTIDASQENVIHVMGEGETLSGAIDNISLIDGKRIYMSETKLLILGGGFESANAMDALNTLYFDMRCSLNMPVCCVGSGKRAEDIGSLQFTEGMTSADKLLSLIENAHRMGVSPKTTLLDLLADSADKKASLLPMLTVTENGIGMTLAEDSKTAVLCGSRYFDGGVLRGNFDPDKTAALMLLSGKSDKLTLNYICGGEERTCEAYDIKITDEAYLDKSIRHVTAKFRTRGGGKLSEEERKEALNALMKIVI